MFSYLVTGASGQLGHCFQAIAKEFPEIHLFFASRYEVDITKSETVLNFYNELTFDGIINCAAYTDVDQSEKEREKAHKINTEALQKLIDFAENKNLSIIHFSTDYVFDGQSYKPYLEDGVTNPLGVYAMSKVQGEILLSKSSCKSVIVRSSWLFSPFGKNFVKTIARLSKEKMKLKVVNDQYGRPTYGIDLARAILKLILKKTMYTFPILHYSNQGVCNWNDFAQSIINELEYKTIIQGIPTSAYPTLAKRPKNCILDTGRLEKELGIIIPTWQESLKKCMQILKSDGSL